MMMKYSLLFLLTLTLFSCTTGKPFQENQTTRTTLATDTILRVYHDLIAAIKARDFDKLSNCYDSQADFIYDENTSSKYQCYNRMKSVHGREEILRQYAYLFHSRLLDRIEYEYYEVSENTADPWIRFINVWQNADDQVNEIITLTMDNGYYRIREHRIKVIR
jgi:hypothetical protein